ncbi:Exonuclease 1 [Dirofilaria immitis]|nr:Exonuclease 1 [Dirofilaria immitis]
MGIHNLLPFVKNACRQGNIREFAHQSIAIDVSCLLHRGLIGCADKIAQGCETDFYIRYVLKYIRALLAVDCHIILVFDGQMLPAKKETNSSRREKRDFHKQRGDLLMSEGRASEAYDCFKRSASLTPKVIESTIQAFRRLNMVDVIVAPYESDAQLTFLTKAKMAQAVITEDSDLIAFGCEKIIFKMDLTGSCVIFEQNLLPKCLCKALAENFDFNKFRRICILSGCDYLQAGLPGVGLNKAAAFFAKTNGKNLYQILPRLPRYLNKNSLKVTKQFIEDFIRAENTFLYQIIFDPIEKRQRPLNEYPLSQQSDGNDSEPPEIAMSFALGNIPGGSQTEQMTLPENLTLPERSMEKVYEHSSESSRPPALHISNCLSVSNSKILANNSTDNGDDFVSFERIAEDDCINQDNNTDQDIIPVTSLTKNQSEVLRNSKICSKYFLIKGSKTSSLSRHSPSLRAAPNVSQTVLSQIASDGSQYIQEKANSYTLGGK